MAELLASVTEPPELINDEAKNLHLRLYRNFLAGESPSHWWQSITEHCLWHRVKYSSARFGKSCETPCYTAFFGGFPEFAPYAPVPVWLQPLVALVSEVLGVPFNAFLLRLYFDGNDEIAWHTRWAHLPRPDAHDRLALPGCHRAIRVAAHAECVAQGGRQS